MNNNIDFYELTPDIVKEKLALLPEDPGCYIMKDSQGSIIYIGKAKVLKNRVRQYFHKSSDMTRRIRRMVFQISDFDIIITKSELEALVLENNLIKKHKPQFNIRLRDDKSYPYISITLTEKYPRILSVRKLHFSENDKNKYYGPYTDTGAIRETIKLIKQIFKVPCGYKDPEKSNGKGCLYYHINQCTGVCAGKATREEYMAVIEDVMAFLEGKRKDLVVSMEKRMAEASENLNFEKAARLRDQIRAVESLSVRQQINSISNEDKDLIALAFNERTAVVSALLIRSGHLIGQNKVILDVFDEENPAETMNEFLMACYRSATAIPKEILVNVLPSDKDGLEEWLAYLKGSKVKISLPLRGEKKATLELAVKNAEGHLDYVTQKQEMDDSRTLDTLKELMEAISMESYPHRIETYDISNIQGSNTVASLVTFINGKSEKNLYRKFKIKMTEGKPDDFESMREVITRRVSGSLRNTKDFHALPDLFLIDGGMGQLGAAAKILEDLGFGDIPIIGLAKKEELIYLKGNKTPIALSKRSKALMLLQRMRDEAHRFAITYHRALRSRKLTVSTLGKIEGIGTKRKKALIKHFKSIENIKNASLEELCSVDGISISYASRIKEFFEEYEKKNK